MSEYTITATLLTPDGKEFTDTLVSDDIESQEEAEYLAHLYWTEGNFSCDCNRSILAVRAGVMDEELECDRGEPAVKLIRLEVNGIDIDLEESE